MPTAFQLIAIQAQATKTMDNDIKRSGLVGGISPSRGGKSYPSIPVPCHRTGVLHGAPTTYATEQTKNSLTGMDFGVRRKGMQRNVSFACEDIREKKKREALQCQTSVVDNSVPQEKEAQEHDEKEVIINKFKR